MELEQVFLLFTEGNFDLYICDENTTTVSERRCRKVSLCCLTKAQCLTVTAAMDSCRCLHTVSSMHRKWAMAFHELFEYLYKFYWNNRKDGCVFNSLSKLTHFPFMTYWGLCPAFTV